MQLWSSDFLELIAIDGNYIQFEPAGSHSNLKRDFISILGAEGRAIGLAKRFGYETLPLEIPRVIFDDFVRASLIEQDGTTDEGHTIFRVTHEGRKRARRAA